MKKNVKPLQRLNCDSVVAPEKAFAHAGVCSLLKARFHHAHPTDHRRRLPAALSERGSWLGDVFLADPAGIQSAAPSRAGDPTTARRGGGASARATARSATAENGPRLR